MTIFFYDVYTILPEIFILGSCCCLLVYGVLLSTSLKVGFPVVSNVVGWLSFQVSFFGFLIAFLNPPYNFLAWNNLLVNDSLAYGSKLILLGAYLFWFFLSASYVVNEKINSFEYWILTLLAVTGMLFVVQAVDLLSVYLSVEFQSLVFYVLASFKRTSEFSTESGLKYFILGAFSSALLLFGSSILYSLTGLTNFYDFSLFFTGSLLDKPDAEFGINIGILFVSIAFLFKLSAAPFHMWSPDVYEGAPTSITAFFSILPKLAIVTLLLRFCFVGFHDFIFSWQKIIIFCAYLSVLIGTLAAFFQTRWKRFVAYSSINHVGFLLIGFSTGELESVFSLLFYISAYIITMLGIFLSLAAFRYYQYPKHYQIRYIKDFKGLSYFNPVLALTLSIFLFSMAGIPALIGFFAKLFVLLVSLQNNAYALSVFAVIMSCIACFYYIRLIKIMYFENLLVWTVSYSINKSTSLCLGLFTFLVMFLFVDLELLSFFLTRMSFPVLG
uniref:NADH dehydrogenase subunit 2 n=1 Tax=Palmaria palmata TaxID=2822 RepID=A0A0A7A6L1_PALPL|nr:NADH dehydrogenase subunit 2 [Palmaria palmata]AHB62161.1 NADH dehydrogenase subunit 2 [Palmaria palmata]